jgi:hypothetical protein
MINTVIKSDRTSDGGFAVEDIGDVETEMHDPG